MLTDLTTVCQVIEEVSLPGHFYLPGGLELTWETGKAEEISWEVFRGRLLDPAHTRERHKFLSWNLFQVTSEGRSAEPLLSLKFDMHAGAIHVVRGLLCRVWEGYDAGASVIELRETIRWVRELVGSAELAQFATVDELRDELASLLWQAVVGTSRLPLHSLEAPLPAFALGQLAYVYRVGRADDASPMRSPEDLIEHGLHVDLGWREKAKLLEAFLRSAPAQVAPRFVARWQALGYDGADLARLSRTVFNEVSLSPWTDFVATVLGWWNVLVREGHLTRGQQIDFLGHLLRQLGRHLSAYDLIVFHHRGANYPDALLLDAVLAEFLASIELHPGEFAGAGARKRRRALRHGCLLRRAYEGHAVPDAPTSPGENARVLPEPYTAVPEEQLLQPSRRSKHLFEGRPLVLGHQARQALEQSVRDLVHAEEQAELGMAVFIDRPFGVGKEIGEPDQTPLLAHEAFSATLARRRVVELKRLAADWHFDVEAELDVAADRLSAEPPLLLGVPLEKVADPERPVVSLADARKVADDFVVVRTLPGSLAELREQVDFGSLRQRFKVEFLDGPLVVFRAVGNRVAFWDGQRRLRLECETVGPGFLRRGGREFASGGLRVVRVWEDGGRALMDVDFVLLVASCGRVAKCLQGRSER